MLLPYATPRDHLDDVIALVERMIRRLELQARTDDPRAIATADLEIKRHDELIAARCEATSQNGHPLPLDQLRIACVLSSTEARVVAVLAALEVAGNARRMAATYVPERDGTVTVELVELLVYRSHQAREAATSELASDGPLVRYRLVDIGGDQLTWLTRPLRLAPRVLELAMGRLRLDIDVANAAVLVEEPPSGDMLVVSAHYRQLVESAIEQQTGGASPIPVIVGPSGSGRASLALGVACAHGMSALVVRSGDLPRDPHSLLRILAALEREALLFGALLLLRDVGELEDSTKPEPDLVALVVGSLAGYRGRVAVTATHNVWPPRNRRPIVVAEIELPTQGEREVLWGRLVDDPVVARDAAARYRITGGTIARVARTAGALAGARGDATVGLADIRIGVRAQFDADLSLLGRRVDWHQSWNDVVLPDDVLEELAEMMSRVVNRQQVLDDWGFADKVGRGTGLSALFSGEPGTGKTMVAGLIANELELDLYQIDVSRMVSKWVGETEKNLGRLFDSAAAGHAVLLFDEADSLFAKRTEVKSSNDRYANLEVNYLLQRLEAFEGIAILTTNLESSIDDAFRRRLAYRIKFPVPDVAERRLLWRAMLPQKAEVAAGIDFEELARRFEMSGGYIRNAVLRAAYLAAADKCGIQMRHLQRAAALEATAMGKIVHGSLR